MHPVAHMYVTSRSLCAQKMVRSLCHELALLLSVLHSDQHVWTSLAVCQAQSGFCLNK